MNKIKKICIFLCFLIFLGTIFYICFEDYNLQKYDGDYKADYDDYQNSKGEEESEFEGDRRKIIDLEKAVDFNDLSFKLAFFCGCLISFLFALVPLYFFTYPFQEDYLHFSHFLCRKKEKLKIHPFAKSSELEELKKKGQLMSDGIVRFLKAFGEKGDMEKKIADSLQQECYLRLTFFFTIFYILSEYLFFPLVLTVIIYFSCRRLDYIFKIGNYRLSFKKTYFMIIDNYFFTRNFFKCFWIFGFLAYGMLLFIFYFGFRCSNFVIQKDEMNVDGQNHVQYRIEKR